MQAAQTILVIEDDAAIRRGVVAALRHHGFATLEAGEGAAARELLEKANCDLVLLDLVLPGADGLDLLSAVRRVRPTLPVIVLTARGDERDRVQGLGRGADDYVVKPFSVAELLARIAAVLRRSPARPQPVEALRVPAGTVDFARRELRGDDGARCELSERDCALLSYLAANPGRVVSRDEILRHVWRIDPQGAATRAVDMQVVRLREKLRDDPQTPRVLLTVRGGGYKLGDGNGNDTGAA